MSPRSKSCLYIKRYRSGREKQTYYQVNGVSNKKRRIVTNEDNQSICLSVCRFFCQKECNSHLKFSLLASRKITNYTS